MKKQKEELCKAFLEGYFYGYCMEHYNCHQGMFCEMCSMVKQALLIVKDKK